MRIVRKESLPLAEKYVYTASRDITITTLGGPFMEKIVLDDPVNLQKGVKYNIYPYEKKIEVASENE